MTEQPVQNEQEKKAQALQAQLIQFASKNLEDRETMLPNLLDQIRADGTRENLETLPDSQIFDTQLNQAVEKTLQTQWNTGAEKAVNPWSGGHTLVAMKDDGTVVGLNSQVTPGYESFGDLTPYALAKAVCALHLNKAVGAGQSEFAGGLSTLENINYLKRLGNKTHDGATANPALIDDEYVFLGASGCTAKPEYLRTLLDKGGEPGLFTFAGEFDKTFVDIVKIYLTQPELEVRVMSEPQFGQEIKAVRN